MKQIAILVETSLASGRQILTGISRFLDEGIDWTAYHYTGPLGAMTPEWICQWEGDGIIARVANRELLEIIQAKGLPTVDVLGNVSPQAFPLVKCKDTTIGTAVAKHFLDNAHQNFAFIGLKQERWSIERRQGFEQTIQQACGKAIHAFYIEESPVENEPSGNELASVRLWLSQLPTPVAIMVASDQFAPLLFEACRQLRLAIPDNVSIMGIDNDPPFSELCRPRLSSVEPNHERVGYLAAQTLQTLIENKPLPKKLIEVDTYTLFKRQSSDLIALDDPALLKALKHIRAHVTESPSLDTLAQVAGLSRSVLQRRFRQKLNRSIGEFMTHEKLRLAKEMLSNTSLPIAVIAERSGFNSQEYMNHVFKRHLKTSPRKYRLAL